MDSTNLKTKIRAHLATANEATTSRPTTRRPRGDKVGLTKNQSRHSMTWATTFRSSQYLLICTWISRKLVVLRSTRKRIEK